MRAGRFDLLFLFFGVLLAAGPGAAQGRSEPRARTRTLKATPDTAAWSYYDASVAPLLSSQR